MTHTHAADHRSLATAHHDAGDVCLPLLGTGGWRHVAAFALLIAAGWQHAFVEMWHRWFPAWNVSGYALSQRLSEGDSYYSHGPIVPLVSLAIAWVIYRRVGAPSNRTRSSTVVGWTILGGSLLLHLMSVYARVTFVSGFALIGVLGGLVLTRGGWTLAKAYWLPIIILIFMVPLPMNWIADLNFQLKATAGSAALWLAVKLFGIPAVQDGSYIHLAGAKTLVVENVCGGLRSLISLLWFATLFALVCRVRGGWRWGMLAMALPVAIACNTIRITSLVIVAQHYGVEAAGPDSTFHAWSGLAVFALALAMLFAMEKAVMFVGRRLNRPWTDPRLFGFLEGLDRQHVAHGKRAVVAIIMLIAVAAISVYWSRPDVSVNRSDIAKQSVPQSIVIDGVTFAGHDIELDSRTLAILETNDYLYRRFTSQAGAAVDLLIVFSANNRKGTHPPEVCLAGGGEQILTKQIVPIDNADMRELVTQIATRRTYYLYVYKCGDRYTPNFMTQQASIFINGLTARNTAGALIRFSAAAPSQDVDAARRLAAAAAHELMPVIDRRLP